MIDEPMAQDQALATIQRIVEQRQAEPEPFTKLVRRMRLAQSRYFQVRTQDALIHARRLEPVVLNGHTRRRCQSNTTARYPRPGYQ